MNGCLRGSLIAVSVWLVTYLGFISVDAFVVRSNSIPFSTTTTTTTPTTTSTPTGAANSRNMSPLWSSFAADGSEYKSKDADYDDEDVAMTAGGWEKQYDDDQEAEVQELSPVPMSKNSGSRFVALMWDQELDTKKRDSWMLHHDRNELVEDHVMFCRKRNLYNETFNAESMVDILRSLPM